MAEYTEQARSSKPVPLFELIPPHVRMRKRLAVEVTRALASIQPWVWSLTARLGRTWNTYRGGRPGAHAKERGARESRLRDNLALLTKRNWYARLAESPGPYRFAARAVVLEARRLITGGDWWKVRTYVVPTTGELRDTVYLPEDTWGAAYLLDWCVSFLERLTRAVAGMTERVTARYKPRDTSTVEGRPGTARIEGTADPWVRCAAKFGEGGQPSLPATT